jgi:hypothetical protein
MRTLLLLVLGLALLAGCAPRDRIYDASELDHPPVLIGDSLEVVAPRPTAPADTTR